MRQAFVLLVILGASSALAERQITIPTARKLSMGTVKYELRYDPKDYQNEQYFGIGATSFWEVELYNRNNRDTSLDLTYNLISPLTDLSPGLAFGVQDVMDETDGGVRPFAVATFRQGFFVIGGEQPCDVTIGLTYSHSRLYPIVGIRLPFSEQVRVLAEHDGRQINAALEIQPVRPLSLSIMLQNNRAMFGLTLRHRF